MAVSQYPFIDRSGMIMDAEVCAKKLEGHFGIYAAPIAEFITHQYHQSGEEKLTNYWTQILTLVRIREDERHQEFI